MKPHQVGQYLVGYVIIELLAEKPNYNYLKGVVL